LSYAHTSVMCEEVCTQLVLGSSRLMIDCTCGEGGHSEQILQRFPDITVFGLDRDSSILSIAGDRLSKFGERFQPLQTNFADKQFISDQFNKESIDTVLIDLGISVYHYKESGRGFSFSGHEKLDMRLDDCVESAGDIINTYDEKSLSDIFFKYGEERFSRRIASFIVRERSERAIEYTDQLAELVSRAVPRKFHPKKIQPATKIFQALRIAVNNEFENIEKAIPLYLSLLKTGGRMGIITFHSLEDRIVKTMFNDLYKECVCPPRAPMCTCDKKREINWVARKIKAGVEEIENNPPSRSATLRIVEKAA
jgi:16S rRNA (cytosine1402-N4)-methyltransferase